jgi:hypothetical protein
MLLARPRAAGQRHDRDQQPEVVGVCRGVFLRPAGHAGLVKVAYERSAEPPGLLRRARELSSRTIIVDVEPLVAYWDSGQEALDTGIAEILGLVGADPGVLVLCFSTNSDRRPSAVPGGGAAGSGGPRVVYLASAHKPFWIAPYRGFPRPGVVIGDQVATDGILARRLGYTFLHYRPDLAHAPAGPRLMNDLGRPLEPLLFTRH